MSIIKINSLKDIKEYYLGKTKEDKICLALGYFGILIFTIWGCYHGTI
jgi:hypothetical protein